MTFRLLVTCWVSVISIVLTSFASHAEVAGSLVIAGNGPENNTIETLARAFEKANPRVYIDILWEDNSKPVELVKSGQAHIAVTGSVNQHGEVQPIGGGTSKIEGFYEVCRARGLDGTHGVMLPASNVPNIVLKPEVAQAIADGRFHGHHVFAAVENQVSPEQGVVLGVRLESDHLAAPEPRHAARQRALDGRHLRQHSARDLALVAQPAQTGAVDVRDQRARILERFQDTRRARGHQIGRAHV